MEQQRVVRVEEGQDLAAHYNIPYFETSARTGANVDESFYRIAKDVKDRILANSIDEKRDNRNTTLNNRKEEAKGGCC